MSVNQEVKDVKSINIKNFITALEHMHPDISSVVDPVYALYTKEYIDDPNTWTGTQPVLDLFTRYKEFVNVKHPSVIFDVGIKTSKLRAIGKLENLVRFVGRPRVAFSQIPNYNKHFNNIFDMEVHNLTGSSATLIVNYIPRKENIW